MSASALRVVAVGAQALVEDLGRPGRLSIGVAPSGALDPPSLRIANRLVGNPAAAAAMEILWGGFEVQAEAAVVVAVSGAPAPVTVDGRPAAFGRPLGVPAGSRVRIGMPVTGLRSYLAVRGGLDVPPVLGSRSSDTSSGLGPAPLRPGMLLPVGAPPGEQPAGAELPGLAAGPVPLTAWLGPRDDLLQDRAVAETAWRVSQHADRVGVRLDGPALHLVAAGELPSAPIIGGAVQIPPDGRPIVFMADHPTTGGYPVVACVRPADLTRLAQARPGETVRISLRDNQI